MRLLSVALFTVLSLFTTVRADFWYAFFTNATEQGVTTWKFLDSQGGEMTTTKWNNLDDAKSDNGDKGLRFKFEEVTKFIGNQAHEKKFVGLREDDNEFFRADIDTREFGKLVTMKRDEPAHKASLCRRNNQPLDCIGPEGTVVHDEYQWWMEKIPEA